MAKGATRNHKQCMLSGASRYAGFTLVELMIVCAIMSILASVFIIYQPERRLKDTAREIYAYLQITKMEAIKRNANVVMVFNSVDCSGPPNFIPSLGGGYTVFVDDGAGVAANAGNNQLDVGELVLFPPTTVVPQPVIPPHVALCTQTFIGGVTGFLPNGMPINNGGGSVTLKNDRGRSATITLTIAGGVKIN